MSFFWALYFNTSISIFPYQQKLLLQQCMTALTGMNFKLCFSATGAYQQESLQQIRIYSLSKFLSVIVEKALPQLGLNWGFPYPHIVPLQIGLTLAFFPSVASDSSGVRVSDKQSRKRPDRVQGETWDEPELFEEQRWIRKGKRVNPRKWKDVS